MPCGPCGSNTAITDASAPLVHNFGTGQFSAPLNMLLRALDQVELRMRSEPVKVAWKPSQFPSKTVPYGQRPTGTEVVSKNTPIYFEDNEPFVYDLRTPGPEGGICEGTSLCAEPPANKIPGDTYQSFTWKMQGTAWETPVFCLKDLLFYENGTETLRNFLAHVERTPFDFYDNFIRNKIWEIGEKYILAATDIGLLWNSPDRVSARQAPNIVDFRTFSPSGASADAGVPKLVAIQYLKYILNQFMGSNASPLNVEGQRDLMMVGVEADIFSFAYNDTDVTPASWAQGGMGFNLFDFALINKLPFAVKMEDQWFRGDFNAAGEFIRIPAKVYVPQNGGMDLRVNPKWLTAPYGVLTFMTPRPFYYRQFANLPNFPSNVPAESLRFLRPRFQFAPLMEKCSYTRGLVSWRAEDEFGFQPTGEKVIHVIYRRDEMGAYIREAKGAVCIETIETCRVPIPATCSVPEVGGCCPIAGKVIGQVDYRDTSYNVTYSGDIATYLDWNLEALPIAAQFQTLKGVFDVLVTAVSSDGTLVSFSVDPTQHSGGHFCCTDQLIGFVSGVPEKQCQALLEGGLRCDPFVSTRFIGVLSNRLDAIATDHVTVFFDTGCGRPTLIDAVVYAIDNDTKRITLTFDTATVPDGVDCADAVKVCANNTVGCSGCIPSAAAECDPDDVTPIDLDPEDLS